MFEGHNFNLTTAGSESPGEIHDLFDRDAVIEGFVWKFCGARAFYDSLDGIRIQNYPPPTGGKMPTRSPPFNGDVNSALTPSMKTSLIFSGGMSNC